MSAPVRRVRLVVDGVTYAVPEDVSVAVALLNAGVVGFRLPVTGAGSRGPLCGMGICHECRVTIDGAPHRRACLERCRDGMRIVTRPGPAR